MGDTSVQIIWFDGVQPTNTSSDILTGKMFKIGGLGRILSCSL